MKKKKNYRRREKVYKGLGTATTFLSSVSGFVIYESKVDWANFKSELENFMVVSPETVKLNLALAMPFLIALLVFIWYYRKKHAEELKGKTSLSIFFTLVLVWLLYSVVEATLCALMGAFVGSLTDDMIFSKLSKSCGIKAVDDHELDMEVKKENIRKKIRGNINGTV